MKRWSLALALVLAGILLYLFLHIPLPKPLPSREAASPPDTATSTVALREHVPAQADPVSAGATPEESTPVEKEPAPRPRSAAPEPETETEQDPVAEPLSPQPEPQPVSPQPAPATPEAPPPEPAPQPAPRAPDRLVDHLEQLFGAGEPTPVTEAPSPPQDPSAGDAPSTHVDELRALFREPVSPPASPAGASPPAAATAPSPSSPPVTPSTRATVEPADAVSRWQAEQEALRSLARQESRDAVSAIFRLEPQDPETFRLVSRQYRMDVLLACPVLETYAVIPHDGTFHDRRERHDDGARLSRRYALSIRHLDLPWLEEFRQRYIATRLIPADLVEASLLVPTREADAIFGRIIADCRKLGHSLEEISECHGTFEKKSLPGREVWEYRVTRLVLKRSGEDPGNRAPPSKSRETPPHP